MEKRCAGFTQRHLLTRDGDMTLMVIATLSFAQIGLAQIAAFVRGVRHPVTLKVREEDV